MSGLRHRLARLERGAATPPRGSTNQRVFDSAYDGLRLLEADLRDGAYSWTADQRSAVAKLRALGWSPATKIANLPDNEFELLVKVALRRFGAAEPGEL